VELNSLGNKVLELATGFFPSSSDLSYITIDNIYDMADGDIRFQFKFDRFYGYTQGGQDGLLTVYLSGKNKFVTFHTSGRIIFSQTGTISGNVSVDTEEFIYDSFVENVLYNVRIQFYEEVIRVKVWKHSEPSTWLYTYFPEVISSQSDFIFNISGPFGFGTQTYSTKVQLQYLEVNDLY
jgi:hypothetical protein